MEICRKVVIYDVKLNADVIWCFCAQFVEGGGLKHIFGVFMSGVLQARDEVWNEVCNLKFLSCIL